MRRKTLIPLFLILSLILIFPGYAYAQDSAIETRVREIADLESVLVRDEGRPLPQGFKVLKEYKYLPLKLVAIKSFEELQRLKSLGFKTYLNTKYRPYPVTLKDFKGPETSQITPKLTKKFEPGKDYPYLGTFPTGLDEVAKIIGADQAWQEGFTGKGVIFSVIDSGIDKTHPLLDDMDDDPTTKDPKVIKEISFARRDKDPQDKLVHGTMVAAIIAGSGGAAASKFYSSFFDQALDWEIAPYTQKGIAFNGKLLNVKVVEPTGYALVSSIIEGIEYSIENGADVINISLGGPPIEDDPLDEAIKKAVERGIVVVQSAGNSGPGHFSVGGGSPEAIHMAGIYETEKPIYFSSRGPYPFGLNAKPDLAAPGAEIISAMPLEVSRRQFGEDLIFASAWGTSFSSPIGAAAVGLLIEAQPGASPISLKASLLKGARPKDGYDYSQIGAGIVNIPASLQILKESEGEPWSQSLLQKTIPAKRAIAPRPLSAAFVGNDGEYKLFLEELASRGVEISFYQLPELPEKDSDLLIIGQAGAEVSQIKEQLNRYIKEGGKVLFMGDAEPSAYNELFKDFGVSFRPGMAYGGELTEFGDHSITKDISILSSGLAVVSLQLNTSLAKAIVFDKGNFPLAAVLSSGDSRIVVISTSNLLNDKFLSPKDDPKKDKLKKDNPDKQKKDNLKFGLQAIQWLVYDENQNDSKELSLEVKHDFYSIINQENKVLFRVFNDGNKDEKVKLTVEIAAKEEEIARTEHEFNVPAKSSKDSSSIFKPISTKAVIVSAKVRLAEESQTESLLFNNDLDFEIPTIDKIVRSGTNPWVSAMTPDKIDSFTPPTIIRFPGEFKLLNLTAFVSKEIDAVFRIENLGGIASFSKAESLTLHRPIAEQDEIGREPAPYAFVYGNNYNDGIEREIGRTKGIISVPIQIVVQKPGKYSGRVALYDGEQLIDSIPVEITVVEPKAKLLYDDVFDSFYNYGDDFKGYVDAERLWGGTSRPFEPGQDVYDYWVALAKSGYQVDSLAQVAYNLNLTDYQKALLDLASGYQALILHDKDAYSSRMGQWDKILEKTNIIANYDLDAPIIFIGLPWQQPVQADGSVGYSLLTFEHKEIGKGLKDNLPILGGVSYGFSGEKVEGVAWARSPGAAPSDSGVVSGVYTHPSGHKMFFFGDSTIFELMGAPDLVWLYFKLSEEVDGVADWEDTAREFIRQIVDYTIKPAKPYLTLEKEAETARALAEKTTEESRQRDQALKQDIKSLEDSAAQQMRSLQINLTEQAERVSQNFASLRDYLKILTILAVSLVVVCALGVVLVVTFRNKKAK